jgi:hypothetical protein
VFELGVVLGLNLRENPAFTASFNPTYSFRCCAGARMLQIFLLKHKFRGINSLPHHGNLAGHEKTTQGENIFHYST